MGDAWLKGYTEDGLGNNIVVTRHKLMDKIIKDGIDSGRLNLDKLSHDKIIESQAGCFRQRNEALSYRLYKQDQKALWRPIKRVSADENHLTDRLRKKYALRMNLREFSHKIFDDSKIHSNFEIVRERIKPYLDQYHKVDRPIFRIYLSKIKRKIIFIYKYLFNC